MDSKRTADVVIIGAGVAGLACARALRGQGARVIVLERSRGVGGRCATRRVEGVPVDHGICFYHGNDPEFLEALRRVDDERLEGWPRRILGTGTPCQPDALADGESRLAYASGVNAFPRSLAAGLDVRRLVDIEALGTAADGRLVARASDGSTWAARRLVLALAVAQTQRLLASSDDLAPSLPGIGALLENAAAIRSLTLLAGYGPDAAGLPWEMHYPEDSTVFQLISNDSSKRRAPSPGVLVFQALPHWSLKQWHDRDEDWSAVMLAEAGRRIGDWVARPTWTQTHRWRYSRTSSSTEFSGPLCLPTDSGAELGIIGDAFARGGGVQAAWRSGCTLARRWAATGG